MTEYTNTPLLPEKAKELMSLDTEYKEIITYGKIEEWFTAWDGKVYVSFSGGKDSTVLAYLVANWLSHFRTPPWPLNLAFINTGLEYPEIQKFVNEYTDWPRKKFPRVTVNLHRLRPKMNIRQVVRKYGYSIVSKEVADCIADAKRNPDGLRMKHTHPKHYEFCVGGGEWDTDGLWKPNEKGLGYGRVLDYIGVRY